MKKLSFDLSMGAAGDMLTAALLELTPNPTETLAELNALGIPNVEFQAEKQVKQGASGTHIRVTVHGEEEGAHGHHHHHHSSMADIAHLIGYLHASDTVKENALAVYNRIAQAESRVHGEPVTEIHFHEVGAMDAVADVAAVCCLLEKLSPDEISATPVHTGYGKVNCAHGILDIPAPATKLLLEGIPTEVGDIEGELCTPTGAALIRQFVSDFGPMPLMTVERMGYGLGQKDFPAANCLRAMLGQG